VPALRAGFVVLTDRYIYSLMARAIMRGLDGAWIRSIFGVALVPDAIFYLRVGVDDLIPRVIFSRGFDYWESGMDVFPGHDMYDSFRNYQTALLNEFDRLSTEYKFDTIDASMDPTAVFAELKAKVLDILEGDSRKAYISKLYDRSAPNPAQRIEPALVAASFVTTPGQHAAPSNGHAMGYSNGNGNRGS
jgi:hypothetical protein